MAAATTKATNVQAPTKTTTTTYKVNPYGIGKMIVQGLVGAGTVILASKLLEVLEGKHEQTAYTLNPQPENFHIDKTSYKLFHRLTPWAQFDSNNYTQCIRATDAMFQIEKELRKPNAVVDVDDVVRAEHFFKLALSYLHAFYMTIRNNHQNEVKPRQMERLLEDIQMIENFLGSHLCTIYALSVLL